MCIFPNLVAVLDWTQFYSLVIQKIAFRCRVVLQFQNLNADIEQFGELVQHTRYATRHANLVLLLSEMKDLGLL